MNKAIIISIVALLSMKMGAARANDTNKATKGAPSTAVPNPQAMMAAMTKYGEPGDKHKVLQALVGSWTAVSKMWMGPGKPIESTGSAETRSILGGRFVQEDFTGTFMGKPYVGHGVTGYDLTKNKYVNFWVDNMGTWFTLSEGGLDASGKVLSMNTQAFDPISGKTVASKMVTRIESDRRHVFEVYDTVEGKQVKVMEITYTRK